MVLDSTIVFNEIMYHPQDDSSEWIELHNQMAVDIDMSNWSLQGGVEYTFPDGTILENGGYLVVAAEPEKLGGRVSEDALYGPFSGRLSNGNERVELRTHTDRRMNVVEYSDGGDWPWGADGSGATLAKLNPQSGNDAKNWGLSLELNGTPGHSNFESSVDATIDFDHVWRYEQSDTDLGVAWRDPGFDDSNWLSGPGLLTVENSTLPADKKTQLNLGANTYYFRTTFDFNGRLEGASLWLQHIVDDGAVFFLNGQEISRFNMPAGDISHASRATSVSNASIVATSRIEAGGLLQPGANTLAVEVHQSTPSSNDVAFGAQLFIEEAPAAAAKNGMRFSEVAPAHADPFWVEVVNVSDSVASIDGLLVQTQSGAAVLPDRTLQPNERISVDLTLQLEPKDKLFLYRADAMALIDTVEVSDRTMGIAEERDSRWQTVSQPTPGEVNRFAFTEDVGDQRNYVPRPAYLRGSC